MPRFESLRGAEQKPFAHPQLQYDERLFGEDVPYDVGVNLDTWGALLSQHGMRDRDISNLTIKPMKSLQRGYLGLYEKGTVMLACDRFWQINHEETGYTPTEICLHEAKHALDYARITPRLKEYLYNAGIYNPGIVATPIMLAATDAPILPVSAAMLICGLIVGVGVNVILQEEYPNASNNVLYAWRPTERRARKFATRLKNEPQWQGLITLTPKNP